jgi:hypothetical protein
MVYLSPKNLHDLEEDYKQSIETVTFDRNRSIKETLCTFYESEEFYEKYKYVFYEMYKEGYIAGWNHCKEEGMEPENDGSFYIGDR